MHTQMNIEDVEVTETARKRAEISNRPSLRTLMLGVLSMGLGLMVVIAGFVMGLTFMLIILGLMPIALLWFWYASRHSAPTESAVASATQEHDASTHSRSSDTGAPGSMSTGPQAGMHCNAGPER